jgi:class 3 adenylate cyclase
LQPVAQVVDFLNMLYTKLDEMLDRYDTYKVETIGDAYMVVSGLPQRNGIRHSNDICTMALDILMMTRDFAVPHSPHERLIMRLGISTGQRPSD